MGTNIVKKLSSFLLVLSLLFSGNFLFLPTKTSATVYPESDVPQILPRSTWDNTPELNALMTWLPDKNDGPGDWQPVERIIVHHAATPNNDPIDPIARIQSIYRFQAVTQGWGDIGYSYIIDQQGRIYEGRYGGNGSRAAHVYYDKQKDNFNYGTIGIVVLGDYTKANLPAAAENSLVRLIGWLAAANNIDPAQMNRSTSVWNTLLRLFGSSYTMPTVLGHKDIESTNCPGNLDMAKIRQQAAQYSQKFKNYIYQTNDSPKIYKLADGTRRVYPDLPSFQAQGGAYEKLVIVSQAQLDIFSESRFLKYPDGSLLQTEGSPSIYLVDGGKKRSFSVSAKEFIALGFDFSVVKKISASELAGYTDGQIIKFAPEALLLSDGVKVYRLSGGKKHWVVSGGLFSSLGYSWAKVRVAPQELEQYLEGAAMTYPNGTLVQADGQAAVYVFDFGKLRRFISAEIFRNLKYSWAKIKKITAQELACYPAGDYVKYKDGTLLRPNSEKNVYLISGGQPQIISAATFAARGYRWANVLVIANQDFNILYRGAALAAEPTPSASLAPSPSALPSQTPAPSASAAPSSSPSPTVSPIVGASPKIRIAIYEVTGNSVTLTANTTYSVLDKSGQVIAAKNAGENYVYTFTTPANAFIKIMPTSSAGAVQIVSYADHPTWKPNLNYNEFRGSVEIIYSAKSGKVWAINELDLEDYLRGIAEISSTDEAEYQKAMVVAARTYAQYYIENGGKRGTDEVYILNNTANDQLYKGYAREVLAPSIVAAVTATRGEIITYNGQPIVSAYSSGAPALQTKGTTPACSLWGGKFCQAGYEYLGGGVKDPADAIYNYSACGGANHCVGLSGAGARAFAKAGTKNYQEILKYYYLGTEIKKIY